jgi:hypothetical protein
MNARSGSCACEKIRITVAGEPNSISMCHCLLCQKRTGSTYSVHAYYPCDAVAIEGSAKCYARPGDSGSYVFFYFCPDCGSTVYWTVEAMPDVIGIPVGIFADPAYPPPRSSIFVPHKHPWVSIPPGIPQNEGHNAAFLAATREAIARRTEAGTPLIPET